MSKSVITTFILSIILNIHFTSSVPNIIFLFLDDLGFSDIGYNGATYPTPIFDEYVATNAIKFNLHYSESTCTPSRSSLYTGRYSFKSGLSRNVDQESHMHFDRSLTLYPQLLQNAGYNTFIAGKWDIGYKYADITPPQRGFDEGLYPHNWRPYEMKSNGFSLPKYDEIFPTAKQRILEDRAIYFSNGKMAHWDLWKIQDGIEIPALIGDTTNNEKLYSDAALDFINRQTADTPFYVHYNLITPHSPITEPPALEADFPHNYSICNHSTFPGITLSEDKKLFCRAMLYAQEIAWKFVKKVKRERLWANTVFIVVSDNGGDQEQNVGVAEGQNLPLRGLKTGINEGGIRTPAFMFGGFIEGLETGLNAECVYHKLVHISDWYDIITDIAGISHNEDDIDHSELDIWGDIICECNPDCDSSNDNAQERTEIISMRLCGDESRYDSDRYPNKTFYATYMIRWPWKLVINSSVSFPDDCPNSYVEGWIDRNSYTGYDGDQYSIPNQEFCDKWYQPQIIAGKGNLYQSQCLDNLTGTDDINDPNYEPFVYKDTMLYNLETDPIEACNVADAYPVRVRTMWEDIQTRSLEYTPIQNVPASPGAMWQKVSSYDCTTGYTFMAPWEGLNEEKCGPVDETYKSIENRECARIWRELVSRARACSSAFGVLEQLGEEYDLMELFWFGLSAGSGIILFIICVFMTAYCCYKRKLKKTLDREVSKVMQKVEDAMMHSANNINHQQQQSHPLPEMSPVSTYSHHTPDALSWEIDIGKSMDYDGQTMEQIMEEVMSDTEDNEKETANNNQNEKVVKIDNNQSNQDRKAGHKHTNSALDYMNNQKDDENVEKSVDDESEMEMINEDEVREEEEEEEEEEEADKIVYERDEEEIP